MKNEHEPFKDWLVSRKEEPTPSLPDNFAERLTQRIAVAQSIIKATPRIWMLRIAALIVVGAVGFLRMELFAFLMITGA